MHKLYINSFQNSDTITLRQCPKQLDNSIETKQRKNRIGIYSTLRHPTVMISFIRNRQQMYPEYKLKMKTKKRGEGKKT